MKYCIRSKDNVSKIPKTEEVFLSRPLRLSKLKVLIEQKRVKRVFCSKSCLQRLPAKAKRLLQENNVSLELQSLKGKPLSLRAEQIMLFDELRKDGLSFRKIAEKIGTSKSSAHYLARYAQRTKLKNKGRILSTV